jgi:hypothetical protein
LAPATSTEPASGGRRETRQSIEDRSSRSGHRVILARCAGERHTRPAGEVQKHARVLVRWSFEDARTHSIALPLAQFKREQLLA